MKKPVFLSLQFKFQEEISQQEQYKKIKYTILYYKKLGIININ